MKTKILTILSAASLCVCVSCKSLDKKTQEVTLANRLDSVSYCFGINIGENTKYNLDRSGVDSISVISLNRGVEDFLNKKTLLIDKAKASEIVMSYFKDLQAKNEEKQKVEYQAKIEADKKFLEDNKKNAGIIVLPSGLQYQVLVEGKGPKPLETDKVKTNYHGTLLDGTVFDSSVERGEPIVFPVNGVIKGWQEALQLMPVGSKWKLFVPQDLAYGSYSPEGSKIPPFSTLIFEIELISIEK